MLVTHGLRGTEKGMWRDDTQLAFLAVFCSLLQCTTLTWTMTFMSEDKTASASVPQSTKRMPILVLEA